MAPVFSVVQPCGSSSWRATSAPRTRDNTGVAQFTYMQNALQPFGDKAARTSAYLKAVASLPLNEKSLTDSVVRSLTDAFVDDMISLERKAYREGVEHGQQTEAYREAVSAHFEHQIQGLKYWLAEVDQRLQNIELQLDVKKLSER